MIFEKNHFGRRKRYQRWFAGVLCILMVCGLLGCSLKGAKSYQGKMEIPQSGVVTEEVLSAIKEDHAVVTFAGESGKIHYEWTVFGDEIKEPKDTNLGLKFEISQKEKVTFTFMSETPLEFTPSLSVYLNTLWDAQSALVSSEDGKETWEASVTGKKKSIINFAVTKSPGTFTIVPNRGNEGAEDDEKPGSGSEQGENANGGENVGAAGAGGSGGTGGGSGSTGGGSTGTNSGGTGNRVVSSGKDKGKDKYQTDPVPEGKPMPVEPGSTAVNQKKTYTCTFSIECTSILNHMSDLNADKVDALPPDGIILSKRKVTFYEGESVYDVLQRVCKENHIQMEASWTPIYNSAYVEGIHNLYEFDCGSGSGWMYRVNGWYPNYGCSRYQLADGEVVEWRYTCELGADIGGGYAVGE